MIKSPSNRDNYTYINRQTGTAYTLSPNDNGSWITSNNGSATTITVPVGLGEGFSCVVQALGAGTVTISGATGVTLQNVSTQYAISGQYGIVTIFVDKGNVATVSGNTA